jgi:hypothetical protein
MISEKNAIQSLAEMNGVRQHGNFQTIKNEFGAKRLQRLLLALYPKYTIKEIEAMIGVPDSTLARWFESFNVPSDMRWHVKIYARAGDRHSERIVKNGKILAKQVTVRISPDLAYLIGFALGDGAVQTYMVEVFNKDSKLYQNLNKILKNHGVVTEDRRPNGLWRLRLSSVAIANLIKKNKEPNEATLDYIFKHEKLAKEFIAAFWDAEGTVRKQGNYYHIYLCNTNKRLMERISDFLNRNNIKFSTLERPTRDNPYLLNGRVIKSTKTLLRINIHKQSWGVWVKLIGTHMHHSKKRDAVMEVMSKTRVEYDDK